MDWLEDMPENIQHFVRQIQDRPNFPELLAKFGRAVYERYRSQGDIGRELTLKAWEMAPANTKVRAYTEWALRRRVPLWHFSIVNDPRCYEVYARALERFITPETTVLDIGAGTGILAMLAARAGARRIYTCEMEPLVAEVARENVAKNGLADRIRVIAKKSTEVVVGEDLPERAGLVVSEIVDNSLLGQEVLPSMEDARQRLITPEAAILPGQTAARGVLVGGAEWTWQGRIGQVYGFDLSAFNRLAPPVIAASAKQVAQGLGEAYSAPVEVFRFDFNSQNHFPPTAKTLGIPIVRDGAVDGFLQWLWLGFGNGIVLDNAPPCPPATWSPQLHLFPEPFPVKKGQIFSLRVEHDRESIHIWPQIPAF